MHKIYSYQRSERKIANFQKTIVLWRIHKRANTCRIRSSKIARKKGRAYGWFFKVCSRKGTLSGLLYKEGKLSVAEICMQLDLRKATFYKYLKLRGVSFLLIIIEPGINLQQVLL
jgi:hypothetical protein